MKKIANFVKKGHQDVWGAFKESVKIPGYAYYEPPAQLKYRFPAPGSCPMDKMDHPNLYKEDWRTPYRVSPFNIQKVETFEDIHDPNYTTMYAGRPVTYDTEHPVRGKYDAKLLEEAEPTTTPTVAYQNMNIETDLKAEMWKSFEDQKKVVEEVRENVDPRQFDHDDDYN